MNQPSRPDSSFLILGHRGSPRTHRENSQESFREALARGADGFETDLRQTLDGTAILFHDEELAGRSIEALSLETLRQQVASLTLLSDLEQIEGNPLMILEVKRHGWEEELAKAIGGWKNIVVSSFDHRVLRAVARFAPHIATGAIFDCYLIDAASYLRSIGATWAFPAVRHVDEALVGSLHAEKIRAIPWTVNEEGAWRSMLELDCDGIITDLPAEAVRWRTLNPRPRV